jgi:hypothetical protein
MTEKGTVVTGAMIMVVDTTVGMTETRTMIEGVGADMSVAIMIRDMTATTVAIAMIETTSQR